MSPFCYLRQIKLQNMIIRFVLGEIGFLKFDLLLAYISELVFDSNKAKITLNCSKNCVVYINMPQMCFLKIFKIHSSMSVSYNKFFDTLKTCFSKFFKIFANFVHNKPWAGQKKVVFCNNLYVLLKIQRFEKF